MNIDTVKEQYERYLPRFNEFYRNYYHYFLLGLISIVVVLAAALGLVIYLLVKRPVPVFFASQPNQQQRMRLTVYHTPNLLPDTILRFASKAATSAYTFDYVNFNAQLRLARSYFTEAGWQTYLVSVESLINTIVQNQLFVNGIVSGTPVISNQGPLPGKGQVWRIEIPFLVTYQSANTTTRRNFYVMLSIIEVPTSQNPQGIGIDQFVMLTAA